MLYSLFGTRSGAASDTQAQGAGSSVDRTVARGLPKLKLTPAAVRVVLQRSAAEAPEWLQLVQYVGGESQVIALLWACHAELVREEQRLRGAGADPFPLSALLAARLNHQRYTELSKRLGYSRSQLHRRDEQLYTVVARWLSTMLATY